MNQYAVVFVSKDMYKSYHSMELEWAEDYGAGRDAAIITCMERNQWDTEEEMTVEIGDVILVQ